MRVSERREAVLEEIKRLASEAQSLVEELNSEIEEIRDNLEEKFSETTRYEMVNEACDGLDTILSSLQEVGDTEIDFNW